MRSARHHGHHRAGEHDADAHPDHESRRWRSNRWDNGGGRRADTQLPVSRQQRPTNCRHISDCVRFRGTHRKWRANLQPSTL